MCVRLEFSQAGERCKPVSTPRKRKGDRGGTHCYLLEVCLTNQYVRHGPHMTHWAIPRAVYPRGQMSGSTRLVDNPFRTLPCGKRPGRAAVRVIKTRAPSVRVLPTLFGPVDPIEAVHELVTTTAVQNHPEYGTCLVVVHPWVLTVTWQVKRGRTEARVPWQSVASPAPSANE